MCAVDHPNNESKGHLVQDDGFGHAVDVVAYDGPDVVWEINVYDDICDALGKPAIEVYLIKWGAAGRKGLGISARL